MGNRICKKRIIKCICGEEINLQGIKKHIKNNHLDLGEYNDAYYKIMYGSLNIDQLLKDYMSGISINDINIKYNTLTHDIHFILNYNNIKRRNIKDSRCSDFYKEKLSNTIKEKYGVDNVSKSDNIKKKKVETMMKNHGRVNNFSSEEILKKALSNVNYDKLSIKLKEIFKEKYGVERMTDIPGVRGKMSLGRKKYWDSLSDFKKKEKLDILDVVRKKVKYSRISDLEVRVQKILNELIYEYSCNKIICGYNFDICFNNKVIIEINGDYWHANPSKYLPTDEISYPGNVKHKAADVWKKDEKKRNIVEKEGYKVVYLWESELKKMKDSDIVNFIVENVGI